MVVDEQLFGHYALLPCNLTDLSRCSLREAGKSRSAGRVAIHYTFAVVSVSQHLRQRTARRRKKQGGGEIERRKKKVSMSTGGCSTRKVHVAVDDDGFLPWKPIGSLFSVTFVDLSSARNRPAPIMRKIVRDNIRIEGSLI